MTVQPLLFAVIISVPIVHNVCANVCDCRRAVYALLRLVLQFRRILYIFQIEGINELLMPSLFKDMRATQLAIIYLVQLHIVQTIFFVGHKVTDFQVNEKLSSWLLA